MTGPEIDTMLRNHQELTVKVRNLLRRAQRGLPYNRQIAAKLKAELEAARDRLAAELAR